MRTTISALALLLFACRRDAAPTTPTPRAPEAAPIDATTKASPARPAVVERTAEEDAVWTLLGGAGAGPLHAIVAKRGKLRFAHGGAIVGDGGGDTSWEVLQVAAAESDALRLVTNAGTVRMLVWIDIADLAPQLARAVVLQPLAGTAAPNDGTIELAPGEQIDVIAREPDRARVRTSDERFEGWIDASALAPAYEKVPFVLQSETTELASGTKLLVRPRGATLLALASDAGVHYAHEISAANGWTLIEYVEPCHETVRIRGYVRTKQAKPSEPGGRGYGCGEGGHATVVSWGELENAPRVKLPVDTELRSADGALIGRTLAQVELRRAPDGLLRVPTTWGLVPVTAD